MRRLLTLILALAMFAAFSVTPAAAGEHFEVSIEADGIFTEDGPFRVMGEVDGKLCAAGEWGVVDGTTVFYWQTEDRFRITQDRMFTCDTGETFVLHLRNKIIIGQGGVPGHGTWKLTDSTGFDLAPKGKGSIEVGPAGEIYEGLLQFG